MRERERETTSRDVVVMDVCPNCGGVWLDRGELDKLSQSEERYYQGYQRGPQDDYQGGRRRDDDDDDDDGGFFGGGRGGQRGGGGFLGNFFGGMGD